MSEEFLLICTRDTVGTNASFHCKDGQGYSTDVDKAHVYSLEEAQRAWDTGRSIDQPVSALAVIELSEFHVDCQYIPRSDVVEDGCRAYVGFLKDDWDGNDVYWVTKSNNGGLSTNFSDARIFTDPIKAMSNIIWLPFSMVDKVKRRTFRLSLLNKRTMVQGPGLRIPGWLKKQKRRKGDNGKTRWNCPCCGKISWQYNPYDYDGCLDWKCEEHRWSNV